jgi:selenocysteine-specific elongation factor
MLMVAADEGWREQSTEHFAAVVALGIRHGLVVVTKTDLADPTPAVDAARRRLSDTQLADAEVVAVSAVTGNGIPE